MGFLKSAPFARIVHECKRPKAKRPAIAAGRSDEALSRRAQFATVLGFAAASAF
jgi:hypothetical protein